MGKGSSHSLWDNKEENKLERRATTVDKTGEKATKKARALEAVDT